jgi:hypothetical protein
VVGTGNMDLVVWHSQSEGKDALVLGGFMMVAVAMSFNDDVLQMVEQRVRRLVGSGEGQW